MLGKAASPSDLICSKAWTRAYAAPEVHMQRQQNVKSDMYAWARTLTSIASAPVVEPLKTLLKKCLAEDPSERPWDFTGISRRLESPTYVKWGQELADLQVSEARTAMTRSHEAALQAAAFLAEEREKWMRAGECSREQASDAYFFFSRACIRAGKPHEELQGLWNCIQLVPERATHPALLNDAGCAYGALGDYGKQRDLLEKALRLEFFKRLSTAPRMLRWQTLFRTWGMPMALLVICRRSATIWRRR
eukprot:5148157-Amphidinium_carterae.1